MSHLVLSKNELREVPSAAIRQLRNLDHLNLNENKIEVLRKEAFLGLSKVPINNALKNGNNGEKSTDLENSFEAS